jgi:hypothetical protein
MKTKLEDIYTMFKYQHPKYKNIKEIYFVWTHYDDIPRMMFVVSSSTKPISKFFISEEDSNIYIDFENNILNYDGFIEKLNTLDKNKYRFHKYEID